LTFVYCVWKCHLTLWIWGWMSDEICRTCAHCKFPHTIETPVSNQSLVSQGKNILALTCAWTSRSLVSRWSLFFWVEAILFQLWSETEDLRLANRRLRLESSMDICRQQKRDQPWNQAPQSWAHVEADFFLSILTKLRLKPTFWTMRGLRMSWVHYGPDHMNERGEPTTSYTLTSSIWKQLKWDRVKTLIMPPDSSSHGIQVPSLTHVGKSQHEGKVPTFEPQETIKIWLVIIEVGSLFFYAKGWTKRWMSSHVIFLLENQNIKWRDFYFYFAFIFFDWKMEWEMIYCQEVKLQPLPCSPIPPPSQSQKEAHGFKIKSLKI